MKPEPLCAAIAAAQQRLPAGALRIALSAQGLPLTQARVAQLLAAPGLVLVAGRYEGIDERVLQLAIDQELSIGDYVLSGGELPALVLIDALARLLPGALGDERSSAEESYAHGLLDWPHYTRPEVYAGLRVPGVLSSGDHAAIARWRLKQSVARTWLRRPELINRAPLDELGRGLLEEFLRGK
jgi:tRNA (guanine37-N1)-methyltransferase